MKDTLESKSLLALGMALSVSFVIMALLVSSVDFLRWLSICIVIAMGIALFRMYLITHACQKDADEAREEAATLAKQKLAAKKLEQKA
jgi:archaellum biogenesis protein FlaJ (TadC family)